MKFFSGESPFDKEPQSTEKQRKTLAAKILAGLRPNIPEGTSYQLRELLQGLWEGDPLRRMTAKTALFKIETILKTPETLQNLRWGQTKRGMLQKDESLIYLD